MEVFRRDISIKKKKKTDGINRLPDETAAVRRYRKSCQWIHIKLSKLKIKTIINFRRNEKE